MMPLRGGLAPLTLATKVAASGNGLLNNLVGYWALDEAAGANNALDKHSNGLTLTQNNLPGSATGLVYVGARTFASVSNQFFTRADDSLITMGATDHTIATWVYLTSKAATAFILGKANAADGGDWDYDLSYVSASDRFQFRIGDGAPRAVLAANYGNVPINTWLLVICRHDIAAKKTYISVNNGTENEASYTGTRDTTTKPLSIGRLSDYNNNYFNGRIGPVAMWKSVAGVGGALTATARTALYAAGAGLAYSAFDYAGTEPWYLAGGVNSTACVAAYAPKGAASLAASYVNLANPGTYDAAPGTAPNFNAATGWGFTGTQYLLSGITPGLNYSMIIRYSGAATSGADYRVIAGVFDGTKAFYIYQQASLTAFANGNVATVSVRNAAGVVAVTNRAYIDGVDKSVSVTPAANLRPVFIGADNNVGTAALHFVGNILAVSLYNTLLTSTQVAAISTAMAAL